jgi:hypothetical protein
MKTKQHKNIKVNVACLPNSEADIKKLFFQILNDYSTRFNVPVTDKPVKVHICLVEYAEGMTSAGLTTYSESDGKILIQMRDPFLNDWEDNQYMLAKFADIVCHEFVHAAQNLTGRCGFKVKGLTYDKESEQERYFFDPEEMEARMLEAPYAALYAQHLL